MSMVCPELQHVACGNTLWEALFKAEFPTAVASQASAIGWKLEFSRKWVARERQRHADRQPGLMAFPSPHPMTGGLYMPPGGPRYPPNMIGGDYDRFPQLGGGMGGMGGRGGAMFGGPAFGGGQPFGGPSFGGRQPFGGGVPGGSPFRGGPPGPFGGGMPGTPRGRGRGGGYGFY
eukprot:gene7733-905_t